MRSVPGQPQVILHPGFLRNARRFYNGDLENLLHNEFDFLNTRIAFGGKVEWHRPEFARGTRLWKLTINYQEYLVDVARKWKAESSGEWGTWFVEHIREWMLQNPLGTKGYGLDNWNSYALSLRIVSWIRAFAIAGDLMPNDFRLEFLRWLKVQTMFLRDNVEWDILGNHIVKNWKALTWAAVFFDDDSFRAKARCIFEKSVKRQFSQDGMHEELSPMYAAIVLEDVQDVLGLGVDEENLAKIETKLADRVGMMAFGDDWARFNDSGSGMAPSPENFRMTHGEFICDGYAGGSYGDWQWMADFGALTLGRQPGHMHCDALSFEFAYDGRKIFTNCGVFEYNPGERRSYSRSARSHNTLWVAGHEQHEMWKAFRVGRMGRVINVKTDLGEDGRFVGEGTLVSYDGFYSHSRHIEMSRDRIDISDEFISAKKTAGTLFFHLCPGLSATVVDGKVEVSDSGGGGAVCQMVIESVSYPRVEKMPYFPAYGMEVQTDAVCIDIAAGGVVKTKVVFS